MANVSGILAGKNGTPYRLDHKENVTTLCMYPFMTIVVPEVSIFHLLATIVVASEEGILYRRIGKWRQGAEGA